MWVGLRLELGSTRVSWSTWSPMGDIREPGWAESLGGVWVGLMQARANPNQSNRSPTGGIREPEWDKLPGDVWVGLRLELGSARATGSIRSPTGGTREPEWDKLPGDVWVGLSLTNYSSYYSF